MNNVRINQTLKKVDIKLNRNFYSSEAIRAAIDDFKNFGKFSISNKNSILVSLKVKDKESINNIGYEFCNYVLALMKNKALV